MYFWKNAASLARPGDLIGYDWSGDGHIDHLAIIVRIAPGQYPEISEWGVEHPRSSYQKRGWSYSIKHGTWIPHVPQYARVMAWLLHFEVP
jgi:cell wall-associated NlpC family hydrolase